MHGHLNVKYGHLFAMYILCGVLTYGEHGAVTVYTPSTLWHSNVTNLPFDISFFVE